MKHLARVALAAVTLASIVAACGGSDPHGPDGGGPDASTNDAASDVTVEDTSVDSASDTTADSVADAGDGNEPDARDANDDADASDADADAGEVEAGDADVPDSETGDVDAAPPVRFIVTSCTTQEGTQTRSTWIDSDGNRYLAPGPAAPGAGSAFPSPAPPGWPAPYAKLTPAELQALLAAAQTLDTSVAGTTTTIGPIYHQMTWTGYLRSGGRLGSSVFVDSLTDGVSYGKETIVLHNDPAAVVVRIGRCFSVVH